MTLRKGCKPVSVKPRRRRDGNDSKQPCFPRSGKFKHLVPEVQSGPTVTIVCLHTRRGDADGDVNKDIFMDSITDVETPNQRRRVKIRICSTCFSFVKDAEVFK